MPDPADRFKVGGLHDEIMEPTQPVRVICGNCGEQSPWFTYRDDGGADTTASLAELTRWAEDHQCTRKEESSRG